MEQLDRIFKNKDLVIFQHKITKKQLIYKQFESKQWILDELQIREQIQHKNLIQLHNQIVIDEQKFGLVFDGWTTDFGQEITNKIFSQHLWSEEEILNTLESVLDGIKAIHDAGLVHGDIQSGNIVFAEDENIKILDQFGTCKQFKTKYCRFIAPELFLQVTLFKFLLKCLLFSIQLLVCVYLQQNQDKPLTQSNDLWSIGIVFLKAATLQEIEIVYIIEKNQMNTSFLDGLLDKLPLVYSNNLVQILKTLLNFDSTKRKDVYKFFPNIYHSETNPFQQSIYIDQVQQQQQSPRFPNTNSHFQFENSIRSMNDTYQSQIKKASEKMEQQLKKSQELIRTLDKEFSDNQSSQLLISKQTMEQTISENQSLQITQANLNQTLFKKYNDNKQPQNLQQQTEIPSKIISIYDKLNQNVEKQIFQNKLRIEKLLQIQIQQENNKKQNYNLYTCLDDQFSKTDEQIHQNFQSRNCQEQNQISNFFIKIDDIKNSYQYNQQFQQNDQSQTLDQNQNILNEQSLKHNSKYLENYSNNQEISDCFKVQEQDNSINIPFQNKSQDNQIEINIKYKASETQLDIDKNDQKQQEKQNDFDKQQYLIQNIKILQNQGDCISYGDKSQYFDKIQLQKNDSSQLNDQLQQIDNDNQQEMTSQKTDQQLTIDDISYENKSQYIDQIQLQKNDSSQLNDQLQQIDNDNHQEKTSQNIDQQLIINDQTYEDKSQNFDQIQLENHDSSQMNDQQQQIDNDNPYKKTSQKSDQQIIIDDKPDGDKSQYFDYIQVEKVDDLSNQSQKIKLDYDKQNFEKIPQQSDKIDLREKSQQDDKFSQTNDNNSLLISLKYNDIQQGQNSIQKSNLQFDIQQQNPEIDSQSGHNQQNLYQYSQQNHVISNQLQDEQLQLNNSVQIPLNDLKEDNAQKISHISNVQNVQEIQSLDALNDQFLDQLIASNNPQNQLIASNNPQNNYKNSQQINQLLLNMDIQQILDENQASDDENQQEISFNIINNRSFKMHESIQVLSQLYDASKQYQSQDYKDQKQYIRNSQQISIQQQKQSLNSNQDLLKTEEDDRKIKYQQLCAKFENCIQRTKSVTQFRKRKNNDNYHQNIN